MAIKIPVAVPDLTGNEERYIVDAVRSTWISSTGTYVERFETEFARLCGARFAVGVCNGTVALHLALLALDVRPGDEVIVPSLTYVATANAVRYMGAEPTFVDVDPNTWCLDTARIEDAITRRTKGMIPVDLYGHPADMDVLNHLAGVHGLWVVEDAAESTMAEYKNRPVGSLALMSTFSFYGNKIFTSGEGGAITLSDPQLDLRLRTLRGQGADPARRYYFPITGYNFRLTNLACALLCAQIERRKTILERRRHIFQLYRSLLSNISGIGFQPLSKVINQAPWLFCITVDEKEYGHTRDELASYLASEGVDTRPFFRPLHQLPPFSEASRLRNDRLPVTEMIASRGLNLPTYPSLTDTQVEMIASLIRKGRN